jgi:sulfopyruvate decarboxylase subunit beta
MISDVAEDVVGELKKGAADFFTVFPCEKVKRLYDLVSQGFRHVPPSREEEGVGICAGAALAGGKPAMLIQSSGIGNMINALCSLTQTYQLPLLIIASWRGIYEEKIPAQVPLGQKLLGVLSTLDIKYAAIMNRRDISYVGEVARQAYESNSIRVVLLNPMVWEGEDSSSTRERIGATREATPRPASAASRRKKPVLTRLEVLKAAAPYLEGKIVVCNLGIPCKELYLVKHQKSNFYMLGSMGLVSSIGLGISMLTSKDVVVIDGDGSLLTNLGALSTIAAAKPRNLTILAVDNGVHGSTGNQPTATSLSVDLELTAKGLGMRKTCKVASKREISLALQGLGDGPNFVHVLAKPGNADVPNVPLSPLEIKANVAEALKQ